MPNFGSKTGSNVREDIKRSSGGGSFLTGVKDGKDMRVRFLHDPEDWYKFREHYSAATKFFPCTQDDVCPGCNSDDDRMKRSSKRYAASVFIVREMAGKNDGKVVALKIPVDLANRLINKADRNQGTLMNRDYTLIRTGDGFDTTYEVEVEEESRFNFAAYQLIDVEPILAAAFAEAWGTVEQEPKHEPVARTSNSISFKDAVKRATSSSSQEQPQNAPEPKAELPEELPWPKEMEGQVTIEEAIASVATSDQVPPTSTDSSTTDDEVITEESIRAMTYAGLFKLLVDSDIAPPEGLNREDLIEWTLKEFGV